MNNPPDIKGNTGDLYIEVGETQTIRLGQPDDEDQDEGLEVVFKFDDSETFPAWVINNYDMSFLV